MAGEVNVNIFLNQFIVAYNAGAIRNACFRVEAVPVNHPPGSPNQGPWMSYQLFIEPELAISSLNIYLRKSNSGPVLSKNDLRDQLAQHSFWISNKKGIQKRFGPKGSMTSKRAWGIEVDKHPLGSNRYPMKIIGVRWRRIGTSHWT